LPLTEPRDAAHFAARLNSCRKPTRPPPDVAREEQRFDSGKLRRRLGGRDDARVGHGGTILPSITGVTTDVDTSRRRFPGTHRKTAIRSCKYGESQFLGRTASDPLFDTTHAVTLIRLQPDTTYITRSLSHDAAGNTAVKDNNGNRSRSTRSPRSFRRGRTTSTSARRIGARQHRRLGVAMDTRHADEQFAEHRALAAGLLGQQFAPRVSRLHRDVPRQPAIQLTGGNSARLTFWHAYDFSDQSPDDVIQQGTLYVITDGGSRRRRLQQYTDANGGWEQEQIDLSPYAGKVVYSCGLTNFSHLTPRRVRAARGRRVHHRVERGRRHDRSSTNNIWQASFALSGPAGQSGKGASLRITNAPPGQYILEYGDAPFLQHAREPDEHIAVERHADLHGQLHLH